MIHTALLIIDMQKAFDNPIWGERNNPQAEHQALRVLAYFRKHALPVLHVQHISDNPQSQFHNKQNQEFKSGFEPVTAEPVFQKTVNSAFIGTNLETYLRKNQIGHLVLVGLTLPHCVSTTTRMAANLGFKVTLLADATPVLPYLTKTVRPSLLRLSMRLISFLYKMSLLKFLLQKNF